MREVSVITTSELEHIAKQVLEINSEQARFLIGCLELESSCGRAFDFHEVRLTNLHSSYYTTDMITVFNAAMDLHGIDSFIIEVNHG